MACLIGYGASAVNPYVMFESLYALHREGRLPEGMTPDEAVTRTIKAIGKGLLKILSKMGISTIRSYTGAQIFEAIGLEKRARRPPLHGHGVEGRRCRAERPRAGGARPPRARLPGGQLRAAAARRHLRVAATTASSTAGTRRRSRPSSRPPATRTAPTPTSASPPTSTRWRYRKSSLRGLLRFRSDGAGAARRGRARDRDREALQVGRDVARRALAGGARDARRRHEPPRRQVEHRRGRRGRRALRRRAPLVDQAGRLGPLRRDRALPRERRRAPDQGRPGRQARRGRPAARPQGRPLHRAPAPLDSRRGR